ncbi:MAG: twin-arginine translocase subunit TatC [Deltaproteobacteria bacterium]|nr:MAG: twin-arginine translocase subunit TatC [Deltaproteobacteria bacterium]
MDEKRLPFTEHLAELRRRLIASIVPVTVGFFLFFLTSADRLFDFLIAPMLAKLPSESARLVYTGYLDVFFIHLKISALASIFLCIPWIFYQLWLFIAPGLYEHERRLVLPFVVGSTFFFVSGGAFGYFVVLPVAFNFLIHYSTSEHIAPMISVAEYFTTTTRLLLAFSVAFELPMFLVFASKLGFVTAETLTRYRKYAIVLSFVIGAMLTPPDVITQCLLAMPMLVLYELSIVGVRFFARQAEAAGHGRGKGEKGPE